MPSSIQRISPEGISPTRQNVVLEKSAAFFPTLRQCYQTQMTQKESGIGHGTGGSDKRAQRDTNIGKVASSSTPPSAVSLSVGVIIVSSSFIGIAPCD
jgi:hypothetical protein